jgi:predicted DNA-binding protein (UPF0251 family)
VKRSPTKKPEAEPIEPEIEAPDPIDLAIAKLRLGRPPALTADPETCETVRRLAEIQCTEGEAARVLGVHRATFSRWLKSNDKVLAVWEAGRQTGCMSLRRKQFNMALGGNTVMCIWLGKQYLGQRDGCEDGAHRRRGRARAAR